MALTQLIPDFVQLWRALVQRFLSWLNEDTSIAWETGEHEDDR